MKKIFLLIILIGLIYSQNFEYKLYDENFGRINLYPEVFAKIDVINEIKFKSSSYENIVVCEGNTTKLDFYITKKTDYENLDVRTFCNFDEKGKAKVCWEIGEGPSGGGYTLASGPTTGEIVVINSDIKEYITKNPAKGMFDYTKDSKYEKIIIEEGFATLSKVVYDPSIKAQGRIGVGCYGTYDYQIREGSNVIKTFSGVLGTDENLNYKFEKEGNYKVAYSTKINDCLVLYEEKYKDDDGKTKYVMHRFLENLRTTPQTATKTMNVQVVNSDDPDYTEPEGIVKCGLEYTGDIILLPPNLMEGESRNIPVTMTIRNPFDVPIYINGVNHEYKKGITFMGFTTYYDTDDIKSTITKTTPCISKIVQINPLGLVTCSPLRIEPNQQKTIKLEIESELVVDEPLDSYYLTVGFDYYYNKPSHGCYEAGSGTGSCPTSINVNVVDTPDDVSVSAYSLNSNVIIVPDLIDRDFVDINKDTVRIHGRVNFTNTTTTTIPGTLPVTTTLVTYPNGAIVRLIGLGAGGTNCLSGFIPPVYTANGGYYEFKDVKLKDECLEYEMYETLTARIVVRHLAYTNSSTGTGLIDTSIEPLQCEITYSMIGSNYNPEGGEEEYNVTVSIRNGLDLQNIEYSCGIEDKNSDTLNGGETEDYNFICTYDFTEEDETEYMVTAKVYDIDTRKTYIVDCPARNIGLCLPYV